MTDRERLIYAKNVLPMYSSEAERKVSKDTTTKFSDDTVDDEYRKQISETDIHRIYQNNSSVNLEQEFQSQEKLTDLYRGMALNYIIDQCVTQISEDAIKLDNSAESEPLKLIIDKHKFKRQCIDRSDQRT